MLQIKIPEWKKILRENFTQFSQLADFLELNEIQRTVFVKNPKFILNLPKRIALKIEKKNLEDPLLKQFVPKTEENIKTPHFVSDPVGESSCRVSSKMLHKYDGRVLLVSTSACVVHCRYCFRQQFDYDVKDKTFENELKILAADSTIKEVILSGGDPLSLDDQTLKNLLENIAAISHIKRVRFHTRFPIGIPERIDSSFLSLLKSIPLQFLFVIHVNHPRELDSDILNALKAVQNLGIPLLNQSVLLRGVNDDVETLFELCETLVNQGIMPYYLHQLDKVMGSTHFEVSEETGKALIAALKNRLPGYAIPKYVKEVAGQPAKVSILC